MFKIIKKNFIKDYENTTNMEVRFRYGVVAGVFGLITNVILCSLKIAVGIISGSISIIADAVNNLSDAGSSIVTLVGFKLSGRPADAEHPFGHARYEFIAGLIVAIVVTLIGLLLGKSSIEKIINPTSVTISVSTYVVLGLAIIMKIVQGIFYKDFGKSINSKTLIANSVDSRNDVITTIAVLISSIVIHTTGVNIDGYIGILVSLFILISGIKLIKETLNPLLGEVPDKALVDKIGEKIKSYDKVLGYHDLIIHSYGAAIVYASVHVEVASSNDMLDIHDHIDNMERNFMTDMNIHLVIHMDPIDIDDEETNDMKAEVESLINKNYPDLSIHDFRLVKGKTHTNVLFDVIIPFKSKITKMDIITMLYENIETDKTYYYILTIDKPHVR